MDVIRFKPIEGNENYLISNMGHVYNTKRGKLLKLIKHSNGYICVQLWKNNKHKHCLVHRLVGFAFIDKPDGTDRIDHIDQNKHNNNVSNLRWVNHTQNMRNTNLCRKDVPLDLTTKERRRLCLQIDAKKALEEKKFYCEVCDYNTTRKGHLQEHFKTKKHISNIQQQ